MKIDVPHKYHKQKLSQTNIKRSPENAVPIDNDEPIRKIDE